MRMSSPLRSLQHQCPLHHGAMVNTLFGAAEGIGAAKTLKFYEDVKPIKEELRALVEQEGEGAPVANNQDSEVQPVTRTSATVEGEPQMPALVPGYADDPAKVDALQTNPASEIAVDAEARLEGLAGLLKASQIGSGTNKNDQATKKPVSTSKADEDMDEVD